ncbi:MAG TPA: hypothetical protein VLV78_20845 [Thermoanaerobaculia bacterium]|nr:hypothetical protein [Thermoanaerobaculia bacterium]
MTRRTIVVLIAILVIAGGAFAQKNATAMLRLFRLEGKSQVFLLEASEITTTAPATWEPRRDSEGDAPTLEFSSGDPKSLSFDLAFDTFESKESVYDKYVRPLETLTAIDPDLQRPPMVQVVWGSNELPGFKGVLDSVSTKYTMFLPNGTPVRATVRISMKAASKLTTKKQEPCP